MSAVANKVLVVGASWVGDMVMSQSVFMLLKQHNPHCQIDVLAPAWSFALLANMPQVRQAIAMPLGHGVLDLKTRIRLGKQLRSAHYDCAILLPNSWKSALIPWLAAIPRRIGYVGECRWGLLNDARVLNKQLLPMTVQRFAALALPKNAALPPPFPNPVFSVDKSRQTAVCKQFKLDPSDKVLPLCAGAEYGPAKRWPAAYYAAIAQQKIKQGWQVWLFGSAKERSITAQINAKTQNLCTDFSGKTTLSEAVDLLSLVNTVVSNDSGLMHIAAALDKKIIALYGSSDPHFTPPLTAKATIISLNLDCAPCFSRVCPLSHTDCLNNIQPAQVLASIEQ